MNKALGQGEGSIMIELSRPAELIFLAQKNTDTQVPSLTQLDSDEHMFLERRKFFRS